MEVWHETFYWFFVASAFLLLFYSVHGLLPIAVAKVPFVPAGFKEAVAK